MGGCGLPCCCSCSTQLLCSEGTHTTDGTDTCAHSPVRHCVRSDNTPKYVAGCSTQPHECMRHFWLCLGPYPANGAMLLQWQQGRLQEGMLMPDSRQ
jgi:hypothetical protein